MPFSVAVIKAVDSVSPGLGMGLQLLWKKKKSERKKKVLCVLIRCEKKSFPFDVFTTAIFSDFSGKVDSSLTYYPLIKPESHQNLSGQWAYVFSSQL